MRENNTGIEKQQQYRGRKIKKRDEYKIKTENNERQEEQEQWKKCVCVYVCVPKINFLWFVY